VFWPGAVAALGEAGRSELEDYLHALERKQFIRRERASSLAGETQYAFAHVLLRDVAYGQIPRAARAGKHALAAGWIESLGRPEDHAEMLAHHYQSALELAQAASQDTAALAPRARAALQGAGDRAFALNAFATAAGFYRAALALWPDDAQKQRAGLLLLLGTVLYEGGELEQAEAVLTEGSQVAGTAGLPAAQARIRVKLAEIHILRGGPDAAALAECDAATAVLDAEGDLEGLAEVWIFAGKLRYWLGESPADQEALERAMAYARQSGNHRSYTLASTWLGATLMELPVPADAAIDRAEQLLQAAYGDPWAEAHLSLPLSLLYAYAGRFAEARAAIARSRSMYVASEAKLTLAESANPAGQIELLAGDPASAERYWREGYEICRAMGERGYLSSFAGLLAEALYAQGHLDQAQQMTEEAQAAATPGDIDAQARWRATRAKVLARGGHFPAARTLLDEAAALVSPTSWAALQAEILMAKAEVDRLAGARDQAAVSLRAALRISQDRHAAPLVDQAKAALASLAGHPGARPA
jgi:predicted ATPase